jgi:hypothetical protein
MDGMIADGERIDDRPQPEPAPAPCMREDASRDDENGQIGAYRADDC